MPWRTRSGGTWPEPPFDEKPRLAAVGTYAFVNPVVAVLLGWAVAGEALGGRTGAAALVIVGGTLLVWPREGGRSG